MTSFRHAPWQLQDFREKAFSNETKNSDKVLFKFDFLCIKTGNKLQLVYKILWNQKLLQIVKNWCMAGFELKQHVTGRRFAFITLLESFDEHFLVIANVNGLWLEWWNIFRVLGSIEYVGCRVNWVGYGVSG